MWIFVAATAGGCAFVVTWAVGLNADVSGLIALAFLGLGILAPRGRPTGGGSDAGEEPGSGH